MYLDVQQLDNLIVTYVSSFTKRFLQIAQLRIVVVCIKSLRKHIIWMYQSLTYITVKFWFGSKESIYVILTDTLDYFHKQLYTGHHIVFLFPLLLVLSTSLLQQIQHRERYTLKWFDSLIAYGLVVKIFLSA